MKLSYHQFYCRMDSGDSDNLYAYGDHGVYPLTTDDRQTVAVLEMKDLIIRERARELLRLMKENELQ